MNHAREDAATFIAEYEYDVEQGRRLSVDASAEAVNVLERAVNCIDHQAARIRELEGALRSIASESEGASNFLRRECPSFVAIDTAQRLESCSRIARRILAEGSVKP